MAWTAPRTWVLGELVTAPLMNTHLRDNLLELRAGGLAIASQTVGDLITATSGTQLGRLAAAPAGQFLVAAGVNLPPTYSADFTTTTIARRTINETFGNNLTFTWPGGHLITADIQINAGTVGGPTLFFSGDSNTGIWQSAADRVDIATGGVNRVSVQSTGVVFAVPLSGNGSGLTTLNASNLASGTVPSARVSGSYTGITGTGALNAGSITSGFGPINIGGDGITCGNLDMSGALDMPNIMFAGFGAVTILGGFLMDGQIRRGSEITVTLSGGTIHNWNPTGLGGATGASRIRVLITADTTITGIAAQLDGTEIILYEPGAGLGFVVSFTHEDAGSLAANRIQNHRNDTWKLAASGLGNSRGMRIIYSGTDDRWINLESDLPNV